MVFQPVKHKYVGEYRKSCILKAQEIEGLYRTNLALMAILGLKYPPNKKRAKSSSGILKSPTLLEESKD